MWSKNPLPNRCGQHPGADFLLLENFRQKRARKHNKVVKLCGRFQAVFPSPTTSYCNSIQANCQVLLQKLIRLNKESDQTQKCFLVNYPDIPIHLIRLINIGL